jgi:hypothetical protein
MLVDVGVLATIATVIVLRVHRLQRDIHSKKAV